MELFKASRSKYRKVYGLPTFRGLALALILGAALWFSVVNDSETERWLFLLMIVLILVHLTESSQPFRFMQIQILTYEPPFEGELATIPVQISNQTDFKLELMSIKFGDSEKWIEVAPISRQSSALIHLPLLFPIAGRIPLPKLIIRTSPLPKLFRYWRVLDLTETTFVLPRPVDHKVASKPLLQVNDDVELTDIEQIRDERLLPLMDHKLYLKTGLPYRRVHQSTRSSEQRAFAWSYLENLSHEKKGEQFSYWIQSAASEKRSVEISVHTPFMTSISGGRAMDWRNLKTVFAKWFYAQP